MFLYCKRLRNILEIPMLSEVNKVNKDNPIFVSFLLYFVPTPPLPRLFCPPFINFSKSLKLPPFILTPPPFIMNLSVFVFMQPLLWSTSYPSPPSLSHDPSPHSNTTVDTPFSYTADNTATRGRPARKGSLFHAGSTSSKGVRDFKLEVYK